MKHKFWVSPEWETAIQFTWTLLMIVAFLLNYRR